MSEPVSDEQLDNWELDELKRSQGRHNYVLKLIDEIRKLKQRVKDLERFEPAAYRGGK